MESDLIQRVALFYLILYQFLEAFRLLHDGAPSAYVLLQVEEELVSTLERHSLTRLLLRRSIYLGIK